MTVAGVILAGGSGSRIGGNKPLLPFGDGVLLDAVINVAQSQVTTLAINIAREDEPIFRERYGNQFSLLIDDFEQGTGPLAGVVAGLEWASDRANWLATFPCDTPFLPGDLVDRLSGASEPDHPVAAEDGERLQGLCALWPVTCLLPLRSGVASGRLRSPFAALEVLGGTRCLIDDRGAFFNINTSEDLEIARRRL